VASKTIAKTRIENPRHGSPACLGCPSNYLTIPRKLQTDD
jgi:hypothetical protein